MARTRKTLPAKVDVADLISAGVLASVCPRALIEEVLAQTGRASRQRERLLPAPALQLAALYHGRWEIEGVFDEFKMHLRANSTMLRSKTPDLVLQELWGLLLAHFAIRQLLAKAAWPARTRPRRPELHARCARDQAQDEQLQHPPTLPAAPSATSANTGAKYLNSIAASTEMSPSSARSPVEYRRNLGPAAQAAQDFCHVTGGSVLHRR